MASSSTPSTRRRPQRLEEDQIGANQSAPWPKQGPSSYFPSIEKNYGRSISEWQQIIAECGLGKHMEIVGYLKSTYEMGHGHANALVGWTLAGNTAAT
jgi:hypothetical protein